MAMMTVINFVTARNKIIYVFNIQMEEEKMTIRLFGITLTFL